MCSDKQTDGRLEHRKASGGGGGGRPSDISSFGTLHRSHIALQQSQEVLCMFMVPVPFKTTMGGV